MSLFTRKRCPPHRFEPRYDEVENNIDLTGVRGYSPPAIRRILIRDVYVQDVCIWCGEVVKRPEHSK